MINGIRGRELAAKGERYSVRSALIGEIAVARVAGTMAAKDAHLPRGYARASSSRRNELDPLRSEYVTGNYFSTLGVTALGGRVFTVADDTPASAPATVMSHHTGQRIYGGDPLLLGATLIIEGHTFTVVGVTPPGFFGDTLRGDPLFERSQHDCVDECEDRGRPANAERERQNRGNGENASDAKLA
jgi:MacB-like periplasmic core domain